jgi:CxxC motif-containing protein
MTESSKSSQGSSTAELVAAKQVVVEQVAAEYVALERVTVKVAEHIEKHVVEDGVAAEQVADGDTEVE